MAENLNLPNIPTSSMFIGDSEDKVMTIEWQEFFRGLFNRVGGTISPSIIETDTSVLAELYKTNENYIKRIDELEKKNFIKPSMFRVTASKLREIEAELLLHNLSGFEDASSVALSTNGGTPPTLTLTFTDTVAWWSDGVRYTDTGSDAIQIDDTNGIHILYYDGSVLSKIANPTHNQTDDIIINKAIVMIIYWNTNTNVAPILANELHGVQMSGQTHEWLHDNLGARWKEGGVLSGYTLNSAADIDISFDVSDIEFYDEDIEHEIEDGVAANQYEQVLTGDAEIPVLYRDDVTGHWIEQAASTLPYLTSAGEPYRMNDDGDGTWSLVAVANTKFFNQFLLVTNDWQYPVKMIAGTTQYDNQASALEGANTEISEWGTLPVAEFIILYQFVLQSWNGGTIDIRIKEIIDYRTAQISGASAATATDHGSLTGLGDDDHAQYSKVAESYYFGVM